MKITYFLTKKRNRCLNLHDSAFYIILFYLLFHIFDDLFIISLLH